MKLPGRGQFWVPYRMTAVLITIEMVLSCLSLRLWLLLLLLLTLQCFLSTRLSFTILAFLLNIWRSISSISFYNFVFFWENKKWNNIHGHIINIIKFIKIFNEIRFLLAREKKNRIVSQNVFPARRHRNWGWISGEFKLEFFVVECIWNEVFRAWIYLYAKHKLIKQMRI